MLGDVLKREDIYKNSVHQTLHYITFVAYQRDVLGGFACSRLANSFLLQSQISFWPFIQDLLFPISSIFVIKFPLGQMAKPPHK